MVSTTLLAALLLGAKAEPKHFDEISGHRLNVVEPDGTLRMVIADKDRLPPVIIKGKERPKMGEPRLQAGVLFYNDEGRENGGLIFGGRMNDKGQVVDSGGSLSFDRYGAGQTIQLAGGRRPREPLRGSSGKRRRRTEGDLGWSRWKGSRKCFSRSRGRQRAGSSSGRRRW